MVAVLVCAVVLRVVLFSPPSEPDENRSSNPFVDVVFIPLLVEVEEKLAKCGQ